MNKRIIVSLAVLILVLVNPANAGAANGINRTINFQGKLVNASGVNVPNATPVTATFSIYQTNSSCPGGGTPVWSESQTFTPVDGIFQVALGSQTEFGTSIDFSQDTLYLGIKISTESNEMCSGSARIKLAAVPQAFNAEKFAGMSGDNNQANYFSITGGQGTPATLKVNGDITVGPIITPTAAGSITVQSNGANSLTLDTGGAAGLSIGTTNSNLITIGKSGTVNTTGSTLKLPGGFMASGNVIGKALAILNETGDQDIFTASQSGIPVFSLHRVPGTAANGVQFTPATTNNSPLMVAFGSDTNVGLTINTKATGALTLDSGTTGSINIGTGTSGKTINIGTDNTNPDTINIGSSQDQVAITGQSWSVSSNGILTVQECIGCGTNPQTVRRLGANYTNNTVNYTTITDGTDNDDQDLTFETGKGESWVFEAVIYVNSPALADMRFMVTAPTNAGCKIGFENSEDTVNVSNIACGVTSGQLNSDGAYNVVRVNGTVVNDGTHSGKVSVQFAQNAASGTSTIVAGSYIIAEQVNGGSSGGSQSITLTGDVTGSGTGTIATAIGSGVVTSDMILDGTIAGSDLATDIAITTTGAYSGPTSINTINDLIINAATQTLSANNISDSGALTIKSAIGANDLTLDSGSVGDVNLGTGSNAKTVAIGNNTSGTAVNITGNGASIWDIGNNTLSIQTINNGPITTGTGLLIAGGNLTVNGTTSTFGNGSAATLTTSNNQNLSLSAGTGLIAFSSNATSSGNLTIGDNQVIQPANGNLVLNYKSGVNSWTAGLTLDSTGQTTLTGNLTLSNSSTLVGDTTYLRSTRGLALGANQTYYLDSSGNANLNAITTAGVITGSSTASVSGNLTIGYGSALQPAYGPLTLNYKSAVNTWSTGLTIDNTGLTSLYGNLAVNGTTSTFGNGSAATLQTSGNQNLSLSAGTGLVSFSSDATTSGNLTMAYGHAIQPAYGNLVLNYKSGPNAWTAGLTIDNSGNATFANTIYVPSTDGIDNIAAAGTLSIGVTNATTLNIGTGTAGTTSTVNINNTTNGGNIAMGGGLTTGSITIGGASMAAGSTNIYGGTNAATAISLTPGTAGGITIGAVAGTGAITLGSSSASQIVNIGAGSGASTVAIANGTTNANTITMGTGAAMANTITIGGTGANTIAIGHTQTGGSVSIGDAMTTGNITIGGPETSGTVSIAGGAGVMTGAITIGSTGATTSTTTIRGGTGTGAITFTPGVAGTIIIGRTNGTGAITLGSSTAAQTVNISTGIAGANAQTVNIGTIASAGTGITTVNIGNTNTGTNGVNVVNIKAGNAGGTSRGPNVTLGATASVYAVCSSIGSSSGPTAGTVYELRDCSGAPIADYAEMYPVENGADYGDIVATSNTTVETLADDGSNVLPNAPKKLVAKLVKSDRTNQNNVIGIVSLNYGDFSSTGHNVINPSDNPLPIALNGRVPVKISATSAPIAIGDFLTTSTDPGKAVKATTAGEVIGKALEAWDPASGKSTITVFVEQGYFNGLSENNVTAGLSGAEIQSVQFVNMTAQNIQTENLTVTGNLQAQQVQTDQIFTQLISALGDNDLVLKTAGGSMVMDASGSAVFSGGITADWIKANKIIGLEKITSAPTPMPTPTVVSQPTSLDLTVLGEMVASNGLTVKGQATFINNVTFKDPVAFESSPIFNKDAVGFAVIKKDTDRVDIVFDKEYSDPPIVTTNITLDLLKNPDGSIDENNNGEAEKKILAENYTFIIARKTTKGFTIVLSKPAVTDLTFSWMVFNTKSPNTFTSMLVPPVIVTPEPTAIPTIVPTETPTEIPIATPSVTPAAAATDSAGLN